MKYLINNKHLIFNEQLEKSKQYWHFEDLCIEMLNKDGVNHKMIRRFCRKNYQSAQLWDVEKLYEVLKKKDSSLEKNKEWCLKYIEYFKKYYSIFKYEYQNKEYHDHLNALSDADKAYYDVLEDFEKSMRKHFKGYTVKELCEILKHNEENRKEHLIKILENWS